MHTDQWSHRMMRRLHRWYEEEDDPHFMEGERCDPRDDLRLMAMARHARRGHRHRHGNPFGGNPFGGNPFSRRPRVRRGDVRAAILVLLSEQPRNGYQIMQELEQRSQGLWRPSPGSIYPALQQLEDEGLIRAEDSGNGKAYHLTEAGETEARKAAEAGKAPWEALADEEDDSRVTLFHQVKQVAVACLQIAHLDEPGLTEEAAKVLSDARKTLYAILARDADEE